jgi:hypothetical protein
MITHKVKQQEKKTRQDTSSHHKYIKVSVGIIQEAMKNLKEKCGSTKI